MTTRRRWLLAAALLGAGCNDDVPDTTGDLVRPAGFAIVDRGEEALIPNVAQQLGETTAERRDVFVADSESQGVRVLQLAQVPADPADPLDAVVTQTFVPSPAIFFPLVIPAPGFPTEVAPGGGDRVYVLSPGSFALDDASGAPVDFTGALHVLDVPPLDLAARPEAGYAPLTFPTDLGGWAPGAVPVDVQLLPSDGPEDRLAVLFDAFGQAGSVVVATFDATGTVTATVGVSVGRSPRDLVFDAPRDLLLVAHAGETAAAVHQLLWDGDTVTATTTLDVGGPVSSVVLAPGTSTSGADQAVALRLDLTAVKRLVAGPGAAYRVDTRPSSPLLAPDAAAAAEPGLVFLPAAAVTGAKGFVDAFPDTLEDLTEDQRTLLRPAAFGLEDVDAVMLALLDGRAAFLSGDPLELRLDANPRVVSVQEATPEAGTVAVVDCGTSSLQCEGGALNDCAEGGRSSITIREPRADAARYSARYRGNLLSARDVRFVPTSTGAEVLRLSITVDTRDRQVAVGDEARVLAGQLGTCAQADLTGVVRAVDPSGIDVALSGDAAACGATGGDRLLARLEVYPSGEEIVFARLDDGLATAEVQARVPIFNSRAQVRADLELAVAVAPDPSCVPRPIGEVRCGAAAVCGAGRTCEPAANDCPSYCSASCAAGSTACREDVRLRDCPGVVIEVDPVDLTVFDLDAASDASSAEEVNAVPYRTAWIDLAGGSWLTTFPGSRTMVRLRVRASGFQTQLTR